MYIYIYINIYIYNDILVTSPWGFYRMAFQLFLFRWEPVGPAFSGNRDQHRSSNEPHANRVVARWEAGPENWVKVGVYNLLQVLQQVRFAVYIMYHRWCTQGTYCYVPKKKDCTVPLCGDFLISKSGDHLHITSLHCTQLTTEICFLESDGELLVNVFPTPTFWFSTLVVCWNFGCM